MRECKCGADLSHRKGNPTYCLDCNVKRNVIMVKTKQNKNKALGIKYKVKPYKPREYSQYE